ncbi:hypothetical protein D3C78_1609550 [compost metagenome]
MEYLSFATSIFINSSITKSVIMSATTIAAFEAILTELIVEPKVCVIYSSMSETLAASNLSVYSATF